MLPSLTIDLPGVPFTIITTCYESVLLENTALIGFVSAKSSVDQGIGIVSDEGMANLSHTPTYS